MDPNRHDPNFSNRSRDYSCCNITFHNDNCVDAQRGCLCVARYPFAPEPLQDSANGDYVILSVRRLYGKPEDFTVGKWTLHFGTSFGAIRSKDPLIVEVTRSDIVQLFTCCSPSEDIYGNVCRCEASFSVLVLHKAFSQKLRVQIELKADNRQFAPLSITDVINIENFPVTYKQAVLKKKIFKNVPLEGYFCLDDTGKASMLGEKVKAYSECIRYASGGGRWCSNSESASGSNERPSSGSAILDQALCYVCGVHNVQRRSAVSLETNCITVGTSVFQIASQLIVQQYEQGGASLSKRYLPAVLAVIVANVNRTTNIELVQKAYQATESILATAAFNVVELRELTLYLHQSGIVDLHWHTDHRAYRVNSGLRLMLNILYKYNDLPIAQSPVDGWEWGDLIPKEMFEDTIVQYGEKLDDCLKRMMEGVKEHHEVILMCLECWNLIVSDSDLAKKRLVTPEHQEYLKTLIDNNKLEAYPKLQSCLLQSYILITDYLTKNWNRATDEKECLLGQVSNLECRVTELSNSQVLTQSLVSHSSLELTHSSSKASLKTDDYVLIDKTSAPSTSSMASSSHATRPSNLPCSPTSMTRTSSKSSNPSPPVSSAPLTGMPPRRDSASVHYQNAVVFSKQFFDEQPSQELLREVAKSINNTPVTIDALSVELGIPLGDVKSLAGEIELWVKIFRLLEGWRERDANNNTQALARALYSLNLSRCVEELFKRIE